MANYVMCKGCKRIIEYKPETRYEGGISYSTLVCPLCGYKKETNVNHIHYGQDGKK